MLAPSRRLVICLGLLGLFAFAGMGRTQPGGGDDTRSRGPRGSSFNPTRRDIFDLLRGAATPAERKDLLEQGLAARSALYAFEIQKAGKGDVQLSLSEKGDLEPADKVDVHCKVRCTERGKSVATSIVSVVDNGATVKKGDLLGRLDDSALRERIAEQQLLVTDKKALVVQAAQEIETGKAEADRQLKASEAEAKLADAALKTQTTTEELEKRKANIKIQQARLTIELVKSKSGTAEEVKLAETNLELAELDAKRLESDLTLMKLREETHVESANANVALAKLKSTNVLSPLQAKREAAEAGLKAEQTKLDELKEDLENCKLVAPSDGMVLYHEPTTRRGTMQNVIAAGEPVREGQKLLSIWKPGQMLVRMKVDESLVGRLQPGQRALVTIPSVKQALAGKVQSISPTVAVEGSMASDVRLYPVVVAITEKSEMLRPTMPAQVSILLEEQKSVLRVPLHAISQKDGASFCFVKKDDGIHERKVTTGVTGSTFVEIRNGVEAGEEVVVSVPRTLSAGLQQGGFNPFGGAAERRPDR